MQATAAPKFGSNVANGIGIGTDYVQNLNAFDPDGTAVTYADAGSSRATRTPPTTTSSRSRRAGASRSPPRPRPASPADTSTSTRSGRPTPRATSPSATCCSRSPRPTSRRRSPASTRATRRRRRPATIPFTATDPTAPTPSASRTGTPARLGDGQHDAGQPRLGHAGGQPAGRHHGHLRHQPRRRGQQQRRRADRRGLHRDHGHAAPAPTPSPTPTLPRPRRRSPRPGLRGPQRDLRVHRRQRFECRIDGGAWTDVRQPVHADRPRPTARTPSRCARTAPSPPRPPSRSTPRRPPLRP